MQKISSKKKTNHSTKGTLIILNAVIFLVDFPNDTCEWILKAMEVFAFFTILIISWEERYRHLLFFYLKKYKILK